MSDATSATWQDQIAAYVARRPDREATAPAPPPAAEADRRLLGPAAIAVAPRLQAITAVRAKPSRAVIDDGAVSRPDWEIGRVPVRRIPPTLDWVNPIPVDRYVLRPDPDSNTVYYDSTQVSLLNFSLALRRTVRPDRSLAITGGTAVISISVYAPLRLETTIQLQKGWGSAIARFDDRDDGGGRREWRYLPQQHNGLSASLELPAGIAAAPPQVLLSPLSGSATFVVELTEVGALAWKSAIEQSAGSTIVGVCRVATGNLGTKGNTLKIDRHSLDTPLGTLLAGRGPADIQIIDPQQTVPSKLVVVSEDLVTATTVALRPNQGQAPQSQAFGSAGGLIEVDVTTQDVAGVVVDWSAQVAFQSIGWPVVPASGSLSAANLWTDMIKPDSWVASYMIMALPVDARGQAQPVTEAGADYHVQGALSLTAPYVANGVLTSAFQAEAYHPLAAALPRYPGQPPGELVLSFFSNRNGLGGFASRKIQPDELSVVALIYPDARVEIRTGRDALSEASATSALLGVLSDLGSQSATTGRAGGG